MDSILEGLNTAQRKATVHDVEGKLQILAGPGTGKTKTLTSRVAYMLEQGIQPEEMIVMTFTKAAAQEMTDRVKRLVKGRHDLSQLKIGTFHSIMWRQLLFWGKKVGFLDDNPTILDQTDVEQLIKDIMKDADIKLMMEHTSGSDKITNKKLARWISFQKNECMTSDKFKNTEDAKHNQIMAAVWPMYEQLKAKMEAVDFDDILLLGRDLLVQHPECISGVKCLLVDEFQDSNQPQMQIVQAITKVCDALTVVGDPDQSIYSFRGAVPANMRALLDLYKDMKMVYLERNYRSTQPILDHAMGLIAQEKGRLGADRELVGVANEHYPSPVLLECMDEAEEANITAEKIKELIDCGFLEAEDISVLIRMRQPMMMFERELRRRRIPCHVVNGVDFFDRAEVKTILCYLRFINNPNDYAAMRRIINVPRRGIGDKAMEHMALAFREESNEDYHTRLERWVDSGSGIDNAARTKVKSFLNFIREQRGNGDTAENMKDLISTLDRRYEISEFYCTGRNPQQKELNLKGRKSNIETLQDLAFTAATENAGTFDSMATEEEQELGAQAEITALQTFLYSYSLDPNNMHTQRKGVCISTIHGSKGLEWKAVFCPKLTTKSFNFADDTDDAIRRLIFVAITRAKILSFISYTTDSDSYCQPLIKASAKSELVVIPNDEKYPDLTTDQMSSLAEFTGDSYVPRDKPPPVDTPTASLPGFQLAGSLPGFSSASQQNMHVKKRHLDYAPGKATTGKARKPVNDKKDTKEANGRPENKAPAAKAHKPVKDKKAAAARKLNRTRRTS